MSTRDFINFARAMVVKRCILIFLMIASSMFSGAQEDQPKIGLVLSGGGAKGFAHIGFLKVMEEAGIQPDIITGTSAGSLVGALYSMGYSPDEMEALAREVDWDEAMGNKIGLNRVAIEEKDYYGRYVFDVNVENAKFSLPGALVTGHQLEQLIARLTQPYHHVNDFTKLPIPFKCVATDLETGEPVLLDSGNIVQSIRASMSIPTIFLPIEIDGRFLVDGGLVRNFPVQEAIDMGADIIIGVYTGAQLKKKEELRSLVSVLSQSAFMMGIYDAREQEPKCDVFVEPRLGQLGSNDFDAVGEIIARGEQTARLYLNEMKALADSLRLLEAPIERAKFDQLVGRSFVIDRIHVSGNERIPNEYITGKLRISSGDSVTHDYIRDRIELLYGTQYFNKIGYTLVEQDSGFVLNLDIQEVPPSKLRFALHYDTDTRTGLTVNFTSRNALVPSSRIIAEIDIADLPRGELNYFQYTGKQQALALVLKAQGTRENEIIANDFNNRQTQFRLASGRLSGGFQTTSAVNWAVGGLINKEWNSIRPTLTQDTAINTLTDQSAYLSAFFTVNSMSSQFFPMRGIKMNIEGRFYFDVEQSITAGGGLERQLNQNARVPSTYNSIRFDLDIARPVFPKFSLTGGGMIATHSTTETLLTDAFFVGGISPKNFRSVPFWGARVNTFYSPNLALARAGFRWEPIKKFFVEAQLNYINVREPFRTIDSSINEFGDRSESIYANSTIESEGELFSSTFGAGIKLSLMTFFGPVSFALSRWERSKRYEPYFSVGFTL